METVLSKIHVRNVEETEEDTFYNLCQSNHMYSVKRNDISCFRNDSTSFAVVATMTDKIVGVGFVVTYCERVIFSGFEASSRVKDPVAIQAAIFREACSRYPDKPMDIIVPAAMRKFMKRTPYLKRWDIHMYTALTSHNKPPSCNMSEYQTKVIEENYDCPFILEIPSIRTGKLAYGFQKRNDKPIASFKLYSKEDDSIVLGYGVLEENDEGNWLIGPVIAPDVNTTRILLREIIKYTKYKRTKKSVIYVIASDMERHNVLVEAGFKKSDKEWSRYSSRDNNDSLLGNCIYDDVAEKQLALYNIFLSFF